MTKEQLSKLTNVLIFKDGFYYITINYNSDTSNSYGIVPDGWELHNGFEFASDAYAYLVHLQTKEEVTNESKTT